MELSQSNIIDSNNVIPEYQYERPIRSHSSQD